jgi:uncharacterized protein YacL|tara:strand:- start:182 stop:421 length:240 start_codon:yes stop_codon:yes gene_type:complete
MFIHVLMQMVNQKWNHAMVQLLVGLLMSLLLQVLCMRGMSVLSWIIVFIPFILYTYMMILLYNVFGLEPTDEMKQFLVN